MVSPRQVGPNSPFGLRRPDRSVDLRQEVPHISQWGRGAGDLAPTSGFADPQTYQILFHDFHTLWDKDARYGLIQQAVEAGLNVDQITDALLTAEGRVAYDPSMEFAAGHSRYPGELKSPEMIEVEGGRDRPFEGRLERHDRTAPTDVQREQEFDEIIDEIYHAIAQDTAVRAEEGLPARYREPRVDYDLELYEQDVERNKAAIKEGDLSVPPEVQQAGRDRSWIELGMDAVSLERLDPGGFIPPVVSERPGGLIPPVTPDAGPGGFTAHPPQSNILPGAPIRPPQAPTILTSGAVPNFQGPQVLMAAGSQEDLPLGDRTGRRLTPAQIAAGQAGVETARGILGGTIPAPPNPDAGLHLPEPPEPPESEQGTLFNEMMNPESRMDWGYFAEMAAQPEQGFLGTLGGLAGGAAGFLGDAFSTLQAAHQRSGVPHAQAAQAQLGAFENASTEDKLAIALAVLAAVAGGTGVGGPLVPPLLAGSAALAGQP